MPFDPSLSPADWQRIESVFHACADKSPAEQRAILDAECGGNAAIRDAVEALLRADADGDALSATFQRSIASELRTYSDEQSAGLINAQLGPWRIVQLIGHGGMGVVYAGRRADDRFEKKVAIKVLRMGFVTPSDVERFRRERRILANLEHPNIARLIDGGEVMAGGVETPYIVMEFVDGQTITTYCESRQLDIRARIQLFMRVLDAVQYAHQHFVLHRDLTPSNIFVTATHEVKLLDFGIATLISADDGPSPVETRALTPEYSSPEQARGGKLSAATDVFSLGAVLYQLLTGRQPHVFRSSDPLEIIRAISDDPPEPPKVNEDLDNIVLKALQKEPERRYASVAQFADDLTRYLDGRAVLARPDSLAYRAKKFVARNRWAVAGSALFAAAVILGVAGTAYQARRANMRADELRALAGQLLFQVHDSIATLPGATEARSVLVKTSVGALDRLTSDAGDNPEFLLDLAASYERLALLQGGPSANIGALDEAAASYRKAADIYARLPVRVVSQPEVMRKASACWTRLGSVLMNTGHLADAKPAMARAVEFAERARSTSGAPSIELVDALRYSGDLAINSGNSAEALPLYQKASSVMEELVALDPHNADFVRRLAVVSFRAGEAEIGVGALSAGSRRIAQAVARIRALAKSDPKSPTFGREVGIMAMSLANTAGIADHLNLGHPDEALAWARTALDEFTRLATSDPANARGQLDLAQAYALLGAALRESDPGGSLAAYEHMFAILDQLPAATRNSPRNKVLRLRFEREHAAALTRADRSVRSVPSLKRTLAAFQALGADFTDDIGFTLLELARAEDRHGDTTAAMHDLERAITTLTGIVTVTLDARHGLSDALLLQSEWLARDASTCAASGAARDRAIALWRELESNPVSEEIARLQRQAIEAAPRATREPGGRRVTRC